ncbi:MAG: LytTR family DNA-binding domain-containing protein [Pseudomonadota bacterium]
MNLQRYLQHRTWFEFAILVGLVVVGCLSNVATESIDHARLGHPQPVAMAWVLEGTSHLGLLFSIPLVLWFDRFFPLRFDSWKVSLPAHLAFSLAFSLVHVGIMFVARVVIFPLVFGSSYGWGDPIGEFFYEYLKDFRTYFLIISVVYLGRFILLRLQGEAGFLTEQRANADAAPTLDRFLVKKLGREFLVKTEDIDWIESAGNYVNLHVEQKAYPLRSTMAQIAERLGEVGFIRVHRQAIVNLERIAELNVFESGDGELTLINRETVPLSRRFRKQLRGALEQQPSQ